MTPAKTCTKANRMAAIAHDGQKNHSAKILPAWTRRFGSIALLDIIPRIRVVIRSKDLHVLCYSRAFRVSSAPLRAKGPGCNRSRSRATKEKLGVLLWRQGDHVLLADGISLIARVKRAGEVK